MVPPLCMCTERARSCILRHGAGGGGAGGSAGGGQRRGVLRRRKQLLRKTCALACGDDPNEALEERQCPGGVGAGKAGRGGGGGRGATVLPSHVRDGKGGDKKWAGCNHFFFLSERS